MRTNGRIITALSLLSLLCIAGPGLASDQVTPQQLFTEVHKCSTCHSIVAVGIEAKSEKSKGSDLGGFETDDAAALGEYLRKTVELEGEKHKKTFKGTDEELAILLAWIKELDPAPEP